MIRIFLVARSEVSFVNFRLDWVKYMLDRGVSFSIAIENISTDLLSELESYGVEVFVFSNKPIPRLNFLEEFSYFYWVTRIIKHLKNPSIYVFVYFLRSAFWFSLLSRSVDVRKRIFLIEGLGSLGKVSSSAHFKIFFDLIVRFICVSCDLVICLNRRDFSVFESVANVNVKMIPGIGFDRVKYLGSVRYSVKNVLFAGRLLKSKGFDKFLDLAEVFASSDLVFQVAGSLSELSSELKIRFEYLQKKGLISYLGYRRDIEEVFFSSDLFVFPSSYNEGLPRALMEALASGCVVFSSRFNSHEHFIEASDFNTSFISQFYLGVDVVKEFGLFLQSLSEKTSVEYLSRVNIETSLRFDKRNVYPTLEALIFE